MPTDEAKGSHHFDESCRILIISASLKASVAFIGRLKSLNKASLASDVSSSDSKSKATADGTINACFSSSPDTQSQPGSLSRGPQITPYTLSNRYYSAEVHFAAYALDTVFPGLFSLDRGPGYKPPPAVVFVWQEGESYAKLVEELAKVMEAAGYEPEVCLAVRIPGTQDGEEDAREDGQEEDTEIDTTLMSYGFEYVDGRQDSPTKTELADGDSDDIPRLPRVLDALSTIMWPSMQSSSTRTKLAKTGIEHSTTNTARREWEQESIMEELFSVSSISGISRGEASRNMPSIDPSVSRSATVGSGTDTGSEVDSIFSPYDFTLNAQLGGGPFTTSGPVASPMDITAGASSFELRPQQDQAERLKTKVSMGFEDDFTVFVSAPPEADAGISGAPETKRRKAPPVINLGSDSGAGADFENAAGLGLGSTTPLGTAFADSVRTGDNLTPATAFGGTGRDATRRSTAYHSLGSVSDFGDFEDERGQRHVYHAIGGAHTDDEDHAEEWEDEVDEHDESWEEHTGDWEDSIGDSWDDMHDNGMKGDGGSDDEGMPTRDEIMVTAARIFGGVPVSGSTSGFRTAADVKVEQEVLSQQPKTRKPSGTTGKSAAAGLSAERMSDDTEAAASDEDDELGPAGGIDIEHVLRSLQGLKTEIAGVEDEEERRRMAARVALGFVYGMDLDLDGKREL